MSTPLKALLLQQNNKQHWKRVAHYVLEKELQKELIDLFLSEDAKVSQRASAIFMTLVDIEKNIFLPHQEKLVEHLFQTPTNTQKRNIFRLFQFIFIKEEVEGKLLDSCFNVLEDFTQPIAVRAFAMTVAYRLGERYPEIFPELEALIYQHIELAPSTGLINRAKKILQKIREYEE